MTKQKWFAKRGFTLLEILVAMSILAIGLMGMTLLITGVMRTNKSSAKITIATTLLQDQMEKVKSLGYANVVTETQDYNTMTSYPVFKRVTAVASDSPSTGIKTVTVTVYWDADNHSVSAGTLMCQ